jgi:hypothetical protein
MKDGVLLSVRPAYGIDIRIRKTRTLNNVRRGFLFVTTQDTE